MSKIEKENMDRNFRSYDDDKEVEEEGFSSNAQRKAAFASGYKAKGKKGKKSESVNEAKEPDVIIQLRKIVKDRQNALVIDTKSKKKVRVDMQSANLIVQVYDALKQQSNKNKFVKGGIAMMGHTAFKLMKRENVNEAYVVLHSPKKGVKPVATAAYANKKDAQKWAKDLGGITMIVKKNIRGLEESVNEGKKRYYQQNRVGSAKYTISYHDGKKKHKDGSDFFDIQTFKNKKDLAKFVNALHKGGYKYGFGESVNEGLKSNDMYTMLDIAAGYSSTQDQAANQMWSDEQDLYDYLKSDHIPKKYHKKFHKDIKRRFKNIKESVNEAKAKYPNFDLDKNIRYQSTSISKGMWRYTGKEQGGKGVYRNLNNGQFLGFSSDDFKYFKKHLKRHFDIDESINEACWDTHKQVGMKTKGGKQVPNCVPKGESVVKEDKNQIIQLKKKVGKSEIKFYDALSKIEKKLGKKSYRKFIEKGLSDFKINPKHYDYRSNGAAEEKLFNLAK